MKTLQELLQEVVCVFDLAGISSSKRQAEDLFCDFFVCSRVELHSKKHKVLTESELKNTQEWVKRRLAGEPLSYISGAVDFYGCQIAVNPTVLIPRPETEILVDRIVSFLKKREIKGGQLWDICCGSGCIGIALKKALPALSVYLSDDSPEAVLLAAHNAKVNEVDVVCFQGDLLSPFMGMKADYVVSNPPYISTGEYLELDREVRDYEPYHALVGGADGLLFYERFSVELPNVLSSGGCVWFEIGYSQGEAVSALFQGAPWKKNRVENDWAGHNRFFFLEIE
ncbi:MAG: peptide chain release factor N(5)-glutamine methyltransferase [Parachlamydiaceae bacterium]